MCTFVPKRSAPQQKAAPRGAEKRRSAEYADARGALQTAIALDDLANGASKPGGLSGNAWGVGLGVLAGKL